MSGGLRILVCGGRDYKNAKRLNDVLFTIEVVHGIGVIIHGGATGADSLAGAWAKGYACTCIIEYADWNRYGPAAGATRNQKMLDEHKPDMVVAFPGGRGTADMVKRAKAAGVTVQEVQS